METPMKNKEELSAVFYAVVDNTRNHMLLWRHLNHDALSHYHTAPMTDFEREVFQSMVRDGTTSADSRSRRYTYRVYTCVRWYADYMVVRVTVRGYDNCYRVVNVMTGEESQLYAREECDNIVRLARDNALLGSFGLSKLDVSQDALSG